MNSDNLSKLANWASLISLFISLVSLVITIIISIRAQTIKKELEKIDRTKSFRESKKSIIRRVGGLIKTLDEDDIMDLKFTFELRTSVNQLIEYNDIIRIRHRAMIFYINRLTRNGINNKNKNKLVALLSKLIGEMKSMNPITVHDMEVQDD